ncbi:MAG: nucleotide exchange factor GrpE [Hyphomicrobiaceae bacterium]
MANEKQTGFQRAPQAEAAKPAGPPDGETRPEAEAETAAPATHADDMIAALRVEVADLKDRILRTHADMENLRKRLEREKDETARYAITKFARDVVGLSDNFQRAISSVPAGAAEQDPALKSFLDGVMMTEREFLNVLERHGIVQMSPLGEPFDPHQHQAVMEMQNPDVPAGTVVQVFQAGYAIDKRVLRPAMVVVAKGGPKPEKAGEGAANDDQTPASNGPEDEIDDTN